MRKEGVCGFVKSNNEMEKVEVEDLGQEVVLFLFMDVQFGYLVVVMYCINDIVGYFEFFFNV